MYIHILVGEEAMCVVASEQKSLRALQIVLVQEKYKYINVRCNAQTHITQHTDNIPLSH